MEDRREGTGRRVCKNWMGCWILILSGILMVGVWNVWQLVAVPGSGLVLPALCLFVLQSEPALHTKPWTQEPVTSSLLQLPSSLVWVLIFNYGAL